MDDFTEINVKFNKKMKAKRLENSMSKESYEGESIDFDKEMAILNGNIINHLREENEKLKAEFETYQQATEVVVKSMNATISRLEERLDEFRDS